MGVCGQFIHSITHNPITLRIVLNVVLSISDLDFVFSMIFLQELYVAGGIFHVFLGASSLGLCTYAAGAFWFAPQQKFKVVKEITRDMALNPNWYEVECGREKVHVTTEFPLKPEHEPRHPSYQLCNGVRRFKHLEADKDGCAAFREGLSNWGLINMWNYAEAKNRLNSCERKHAVPFFRLARMGFMAAPTPKDLCGILNACALYTFAVGVMQIVWSFALLIMTNDWCNLYIILPLSISLVSLVLSVLNVLLDFATILNELEIEHRLTQEITVKNENTRLEKQRLLDDELKQQENEIENRFRGLTGIADSDNKNQQLARVRNDHFRSMKLVDQRAQTLLKDALTAHKQRTQATKELIRDGKAIDADHPVFLLDEDFAKQQKDLDAHEKAINEQRSELITAIDPKSLSTDEFELQMQNINALAQTKLRTVAQSRVELMTRFSDDPTVSGLRNSLETQAGAKAQLEQWDKQLKIIEDGKVAALAKLDPLAMSMDHFQQETLKIEEDFDKKAEFVNGRKRALEDTVHMQV